METTGRAEADISRRVCGAYLVVSLSSPLPIGPIAQVVRAADS
jgi:hypothetical protein